MRNLFARLGFAAALAVMGLVTPAVSSAEPLDCPGGQYWDPTGNVCRPLGDGPQPLNCPAGEYWHPGDNVCKPLGQP